MYFGNNFKYSRNIWLCGFVAGKAKKWDELWLVIDFFMKNTIYCGFSGCELTVSSHYVVCSQRNTTRNSAIMIQMMAHKKD